jgi:hypothetical protein
MRALALAADRPIASAALGLGVRILGRFQKMYECRIGVAFATFAGSRRVRR